MNKFKINGKEYEMRCNIGALTVAEALNEKVDPKAQPVRFSLGMALAMFYGADRNCDLTIEDILTEFGDSQQRFAQLMEAVNEERARFEGKNETDEPEPAATEDPKKD